MPKTKVTAQPSNGSSSAYQSRADLLAVVQKQARVIAKMRAELAAMKSASIDDDETDPDALPEVDTDGLPFRPKAVNTTPTAQPRSTGPVHPINLGTGRITIRPTPYVRSLFAKQRRGLGGFQSLHAALQARMAGTRQMDLSAQDFARVVNYAVNYGEGGFQQSLRWLVALAVAENIGQLQSAAK